MKKTVADSKSEVTRLLRYQHLNGQRRLFGGALMQWIDELAGTVAYRHAGCNVTTASIDNLVFKQPASLNDLVVLSGRITYVGSTSMEVRVDTYVEKLDGTRHSINKAYLVFVATDDDGAPTPVPGLMLQTDEQRQEWAAGEKRYNLRKTRRREDF